MRFFIQLFIIISVYEIKISLSHIEKVLPEYRFPLLLFEPEYERGLVPGGGPGGVAGQAGRGARDC